MSIIEEIKQSFREGTVLTKLIYFNIGVFLFLHAIIAILYLSSAQDNIMKVVSWMAVPADLQILLTRPWTILTYMFLHKDFFHILFNVLWLYWFGKIFLSYFGEKRLSNIYLLGGFAGALLYIVSYNIFPVFNDQIPESMALGASAAVMAIVIATSAYAPNHTVYLVFVGPVKIVWIAVISFILSSIVDFSVNTGGKIAHIGGALFGYFFAIQYRHGRDITTWFSKIMDYLFSLFQRRNKMKVTYKRAVDDFGYNAQKKAKQQEIDIILDKISQKGYDSLTKEEKEKLFRMSR